jgi:hypothetical protein
MENAMYYLQLEEAFGIISELEGLAGQQSVQYGKRLTKG